MIHFSKKSGRLSSTGSEILSFSSHCSANFHPILDCFIPKFKLKYDDLENIKTDRVNTVVFNLHQIKQSKFFFGIPGSGRKSRTLNVHLLVSALSVMQLSISSKTIPSETIIVYKTLSSGQNKESKAPPLGHKVRKFHECIYKLLTLFEMKSFVVSTNKTVFQ